MNTSTFKQHLEAHPEAELAFVLPNGKAIPAHAHVTEVGRVEKRFIDCGGTHRSWVTTNLQTWVDRDVEHRFPAGKLARILDLAAPLFDGEDPNVEIEHEEGVLSQYPVEDVQVIGRRLVVTLVAKHADCLAKDICLPAGIVEEETSCCGGSGCC
jgi:hypothetical protein